MTFLGLFVIPGIDLMFKFQTLVKVILIPFKVLSKKGAALSDSVNDGLQVWVENALDMNAFEIQNFKQ